MAKQQAKATEENKPNSYMTFENERIFDKALMDRNDVEKNGLLQKILKDKFDIQLHKKVSFEQSAQVESVEQGKKKKKQIKKVKAVLIGSTAQNRDIATAILAEVQKEHLNRESSALKAMLEKPIGLFYDSKKYADLDDHMIDAGKDLLTKLAQHEELRFFQKDQGVKKDMTPAEQKAQENKNNKHNNEAKVVQGLIGNALSKKLGTLRSNQPMSAMVNKLNELVDDLSKRPFTEVNIDLIGFKILGHISKIEEAAKQGEMAQNTKKENLYSRLGADEKKDLNDHILVAVREKNLKYSGAELVNAAKNAVLRLDDVGISDAQLKDIVEKVSNAKKIITPKLSTQQEKEAEVIRADEAERRIAFKYSVLTIARGEKSKDFIPRNEMQAQQIANMQKGGLNIVSGPAGSGKTATAIAFGLSELEAGRIKRLVLTSPMVELDGKNTMGYLPGGELEKMGPYVRQMLREMIKIAGKGKIRRWMGLAQTPTSEDAKDRDDKPTRPSYAPDILDEVVNNNPIQFQPIASVRGNDYEDALIIVDESQNLRFSEAKALSTRAGRGTSVAFCGDHTQTDIPTVNKDGSAIDDINLLPAMPIMMAYAYSNSFARVTRYTENEIVRSKLTQANVLWFQQLELNSADIVEEMRVSHAELYGRNKGLIANKNHANQNGGAGVKNGITQNNAIN